MKIKGEIKMTTEMKEKKEQTEIAEMVKLSVDLKLEVFIEKTDDKQLMMERARKATIASFKEKYPKAHYTLAAIKPIDLESAKGGMVIEADGELGIITKKNPKTIRVVLSGNRIVSGAPSAFKTSNNHFKEAWVARQVVEGMEDVFHEGNCGYLLTTNGLVPVVIGYETKGRFILWSLEDPGTSINCDQKQLEKYFKDDINE